MLSCLPIVLDSDSSDWPASAKVATSACRSLTDSTWTLSRRGNCHPVPGGTYEQWLRGGSTSGRLSICVSPTDAVDEAPLNELRATAPRNGLGCDKVDTRTFRTEPRPRVRGHRLPSWGCGPFCRSEVFFVYLSEEQNTNKQSIRLILYGRLRHAPRLQPRDHGRSILSLSFPHNRGMAAITLRLFSVPSVPTMPASPGFFGIGLLPRLDATREVSPYFQAYGARPLLGLGESSSADLGEGNVVLIWVGCMLERPPYPVLSSCVAVVCSALRSVPTRRVLCGRYASA